MKHRIISMSLFGVSLFICAMAFFSPQPWNLVAFAQEDPYQVPNESSLVEDGRVVADAGAPVAVIPTTNEAGTQAFGIFDIDPVTSQGIMALEITSEEIGAIGIPSENTLLASIDNGRIAVYILDTGELQINIQRSNGKLYTLICTDAATFSGCRSFETP